MGDETTTTPGDKENAPLTKRAPPPPVALVSNRTTVAVSAVRNSDIWRDTNEDTLREEWKAVATMRRSVREAMDNWKPRNRDSAKRMKQSISQIRLDTSRTWGTHSAFSTDTGRKALERVLVSWVAHNPRIGYCQSFNFLAAMILAVCKGNEDETLTIFSCLLEDTSFGEYFHRDRNFEALYEDTRRLDELLLARDEELSNHLKKIQFELVSITPTWILTCFFLQAGPESAIRILDQVLKSGKLARALLIDYSAWTLFQLRDELFKCIDIETIFEALKRQRMLYNVAPQGDRNSNEQDG